MNDDSTEDLEAIDLSAGAFPAGWYADPWTAGQYRYWTGQTWTGETNRWGPATGPGEFGAQAPGVVTDPWPSVSTPSTTPSPPSVGYGWPVAPADDLTRLGGPPRRRGPVVAGTIALIVAVLVAGGIGYAINSQSHSKSAVVVPSPTLPGPGTTAPGNAPPTTPGGALSTDPDRRVLAGLGVQQADVGASRRVVLYQGGNSTAGATLDLCNGKFPSERLRTARLQVAVINPDATGSLSTEAVLYRNPAAGAQGFAELRKVSASCPHGPVVSPIGEPTAETVFQAPPDGSWPRPPNVERQAYSMVTTSAGGSSSSIAVYLRRGRALLGIYFPKPAGKQPAVAGQSTIEGIVGVFEARMAKLPDAVVNAERK